MPVEYVTNSIACPLRDLRPMSISVVAEDVRFFYRNFFCGCSWRLFTQKIPEPVSFFAVYDDRPDQTAGTQLIEAMPFGQNRELIIAFR